MNCSNRQLLQRQREKTSLLLVDEEANMLDYNDKLLLPSSTRSLKRRTSLLEKGRDWARRLITLHRPRRNTISNEKFRERSSVRDIKTNFSEQFLHNDQKSFDEDGYLSPMEIKALNNITQENTNDHQSKYSEQLSYHSSCNSTVSPPIYRYYDPNIPRKRLPTTSFAAEFQKSLSIVDYIDLDVPDEPSKQENHDDDPLESVKYLFTNPSKCSQQGNLTRRLPRRPTNASSISSDSGYSDIPTSKLVPVHLISCSLIPVNVCCLTCMYHPSSSSASSSSTTCLSNQSERKISSYCFRPSLSLLNRTENTNQQHCTCQNKSHSTMTIYPSTISTGKIEDQRDTYHDRRSSRKKRTSLLRHPLLTDDLTSISRWYKPYLERDAVYNALQQADYGAFILRDSTTHSDCYALSIKVPKFTHDSNIVHYLIEKLHMNNNLSYRIKGTIKQFPTLLSLLTHHSVMPEILPITLSFQESFII